MGFQQSKPAQEYSDQALMKRLESLAVQDDGSRSYHDAASRSEKQGFVHVGEREPEGLSIDEVRSLQRNFLRDPKNRLALAALSSADPRAVLTSTSTAISDPHVFNVQIPFEGSPITNQRSSGRCWLFASTNVFRVALMRRYNLDEFELSQSYLFFWDKLEKSNWFLEQVVATAASHDLDSRLVQHLLGDLISDGGQWDMVYNLVDKYGLVPQSLYPDSWNAEHSGVLNSVLKTKLREYALTLRRLVREKGLSLRDITGAKEDMMREVLGVLTVTLGQPPDPKESFAWAFKDKDGNAQQVRATPRDFAKDIYCTVSPATSALNPRSKGCVLSSDTIASMVSLVHDPRHEPLSLLTVERLGNIVGGRDVTYVNVTMPILKHACLSMLRAGLPVFFGSDVGKFSNSSSGIMDLDLIDYEVGFNVGLLGMNKADRLRAGESQMTHAMVLTAVHVEDSSDGAGPKKDKTVRWRVQNSWGEAAGEKGWFVMSDAWMDEFVYQAVVDPRFLGKAVRDVLKTDPTVLPLWDPMGSLA